MTLSTTTQVNSGSAGGASGGRFLTFFLGTEEYGIQILKVQEIIGMMPVTRVPRTPDYVRGVINKRGKIVPILDIRKRFDMESAAETEATCIIVVALASGEMGIVVDRVSEVVEIAARDIGEAPAFGCDINTDFILGIGKSADRVRLLLDIDRVLTDREAQEMRSMTGATQG